MSVTDGAPARFRPEPVESAEPAVPVVLGEVDARALTDQIRNRIRSIQDQIDRLGDLFAEAYNARAWLALGYADWGEYVTAEFYATTRLRLDRDERRDLVVSLRSAGLSTRAIGTALRTSKSQVDRDLDTSGAPNGTPVTVIGTDGKTYATPERRTTPNPSDYPEDEVVDAELVDDQEDGRADEPTGMAVDTSNAGTAAAGTRLPRRALTDQFFDAAYDLGTAVHRIERLAADDRFDKNADQVATKHRADLERAVDALTRVLARFG